MEKMGLPTRQENKEAMGFDSLTPLDGINFDAAKEALKDTEVQEVGREILKDVLGSLTAQEIRATSDQEIKIDAPTTFDAMLDTSTGTAWQRLQKWYIKTGDPERTMRVLESIGVDKYRKLVRHLFLKTLRVESLHKETLREGKNTNYLLADTSLNSLLDFATNQTTWNEKVHLIGAAVTATLTGLDAMTGDSPAMSVAFFILNLYCVLAQRYSRAQLSIAIDKMLKRNPKFDVERYKNKIGIRLPEANR